MMATFPPALATVSEMARPILESQYGTSNRHGYVHGYAEEDRALMKARVGEAERGDETCDLPSVTTGNDGGGVGKVDCTISD